jgi:hypothetical protein
MNALFRRVDELEVPAFKKIALLSVAVIHGWLPNRMKISQH